MTIFSFVSWTKTTACVYRPVASAKLISAPPDRETELLEAANLRKAGDSVKECPAHRLEYKNHPWQAAGIHTGSTDTKIPAQGSIPRFVLQLFGICNKESPSESPHTAQSLNVAPSAEGVCWWLSSTQKIKNFLCKQPLEPCWFISL